MAVYFPCPFVCAPTRVSCSGLFRDGLRSQRECAGRPNLAWKAGSAIEVELILEPSAPGSGDAQQARSFAGKTESVESPPQLVANQLAPPLSA